MLDAAGLMEIIPHRPPFLFVDSILELEEGKRARGVKHVRADDYYFQGHFPGRPVMPGVLLLEAMAQVGAVALLSCPEHRGGIAYFAGIDGARFRKPVVPGDTLEMEVELVKVRGRIGKGRARATVRGTLVAEAELTFALAADETGS